VTQVLKSIMTIRDTQARYKRYKSFEFGLSVKFLISKVGLSCCWSETMEGGGRRSNINYWLQSRSIFNRTSMISTKKNSSWIKKWLLSSLDSSSCGNLGSSFDQFKRQRSVLQVALRGQTSYNFEASYI